MEGREEKYLFRLCLDI